MLKDVVIGIMGLILAACTTVTTIKTRPSGAKVFVTEKDTYGKEARIIQKNKYIGLSPATVAWNARHEYTIRAIIGNFFPKEQTFHFSDPPKEIVLTFDQPTPAVILFGR